MNAIEILRYELLLGFHHNSRSINKSFNVTVHPLQAALVGYDGDGNYHPVWFAHLAKGKKFSLFLVNLDKTHHCRTPTNDYYKLKIGFWPPYGKGPAELGLLVAPPRMAPPRIAPLDMAQTGRQLGDPLAFDTAAVAENNHPLAGGPWKDWGVYKDPVPAQVPALTNDNEEYSRYVVEAKGPAGQASEFSLVATRCELGVQLGYREEGWKPELTYDDEQWWIFDPEMVVNGT